MPEAERFSGPIRIVQSAEQFAQACDDVLAADYDGRRRQISHVVQSESWLSKVELLSEIVTNRLNPGSQTMTRPIAEVLPASVISPTHSTMMPGSPANLAQPVGDRQIRT